MAMPIDRINETRELNASTTEHLEEQKWEDNYMLGRQEKHKTGERKITKQ